MNTPTAHPENEARFSIDEREDDMLIGERHWQFGWRCIARRPKLITNDEWRPEAERIVAALANLSPASEPASGVDCEGLGDALFAMSAQIKASGFLDDPAHRRVYERVVAEFLKLSPTDAALASKGA